MPIFTNSNSSQVPFNIGFRSKPVRRVESFLVWLGVTALCRTLRYTVIDPEGWLGGARRLEPKIWACWHGQQLVGFHFFRRRGIAILSSLHRDGDLSSGTLRRFGWHIVRGSSKRGGARGLLLLLRYLRRGGEVALTPDGPTGPIHQVKPGVIYLAARTGAPIVPFAIRAKPAWQAPSWDRFFVPFPFARCCFYFGPPVHISGDSIANGWQSAGEALSRAIEQANIEAEANLTGRFAREQEYKR